MSAGTAITRWTPRVFWAVTAVIAVMAWPPSIVTVLMSAWMPAPPPESEPAMIRMRGVLMRVSSSMLAHRRGRILAELLGGSDRTRLEIAAAIRADSGERPVHALGAEGALEGADARLLAVGRQVAAAAFAIGSQLEQ